MSKSVLLMSCCLCALLFLACAKPDQTTNRSTNSSASTASPASTPATTVATNTGDKIGIAECDDFLAKYETCITTKVPEVGRAQYETGLKQWRASWKTAAENPQTRATLAATCKTQLDLAKSSFKSLGCTF